ncbi:Rid family hydrolase [Nocardioides sp. SYSU D00038]|uniref:Rid family hydrolase n=1 Tax=Nocardioides sp. SYSU D00038 TaxID=2812554 RepID=UPI00196720C0|nr:Rid family hydrolase [Nocardioides sp. SYSU D00038]
MTTYPLTGPLDERGRLLHEDDPAAQLALALARVEAALARTGHAPADLVSVRVCTIDPAVADGVLDVLGERFAATGAAPDVSVVRHELGVPGMLLALQVEVADPLGTPSARPS